MLCYVGLEGTQIKQIIESELPVVTDSQTIEITEAMATEMKTNGLRSYFWDAGPELKPLVTLVLDKPQIVSGGIDTANLTITAPGVTSLGIYFNGAVQTQPLTNGSATVPIAATAKQTINITADPLLYRFNTVTLEVV